MSCFAVVGGGLSGIGVLLCLSKTPRRRLFRRWLAIKNDAEARRSGRGRSSGFASRRVAGGGFRLWGDNDSGGGTLVGEG
jgi:hypothetical protein